MITTGDSGPGSLRQALIDANIAPGVDTISFVVSGTIVIDSPLPEVQDDVSIQGPGADQLTIGGSYLHRIFDVRAGVAMTVSDLALTEGWAPNGEAGGAIRSYGQLTLERVHLHDNLSVSTGAAVYVEDGSLHIASSLIQSNTASTNGGIYINSSTAAITGTVFAQNQGSAIAAYRSPTLHITATQIMSSTGRGLDSASSELYLAQVQIVANEGSGIYADMGLLAIESSEITDNRSYVGGGLNIRANTTLNLTDTLLARNHAQSRGGAIFMVSFVDKLTLAGGAVTGNTAPSGAGIYMMGANLRVQDLLILGNQGSRGSALYLDSMRDAVLTDSCIVNNLVTSSDGLAIQMGAFNSYYLSAPNNWWGAADGPSGADPGSGDSIAERVIYANFKVAAPEGCPMQRVVRLYLPAMNR